MTGRFTVKLGGLEYRTSYCLIPDVPWASVLEMVSNTELTSCVTTGPWATTEKVEKQHSSEMTRRRRRSVDDSMLIDDCNGNEQQNMRRCRWCSGGHMITRSHGSARVL